MSKDRTKIPAPEKSTPEADAPLRGLIVEALRLALEGDDAPRRCRSKKCRTAGRCHVQLLGDAPAVCGGGISGEVTYQAGLMLAFLKGTLAARAR